MQLRNKKRRRELGNLIKRFRSGAELLSDMVVLTTEEGGTFWCDGLTQQILGLRWSEDNGQSILNLLRYPEFMQYLRTRDFSHLLNLVLNTGRHLRIHVMPYIHKQLLMVARDVTQTHRLGEARRNFFVDVSHESHTPLAVLQGYLEVMDEQPLEDAVCERASYTVREQIQRVERLVKQLLTLSKIEATPTHLFSEKVDMPMVLRVAECEAQTLSQKKQTFTFEMDNGLEVSGNEDQLHNAISDLAHSAVNYILEDTHITVCWQRVPYDTGFSIEDNGPGTAPRHIPCLIECLYRADRTRSW